MRINGGNQIFEALFTDGLTSFYKLYWFSNPSKRYIPVSILYGLRYSYLKLLPNNQTFTKQTA